MNCKLLLSIYNQLCVVQYGEFGRWFLVGAKVCLTINSLYAVYTFCSGQVGRIKVKIFGDERLKMHHQGFLLETSKGTEHCANITSGDLHATNVASGAIAASFSTRFYITILTLNVLGACYTWCSKLLSMPATYLLRPVFGGCLVVSLLQGVKCPNRVLRLNRLRSRLYFTAALICISLYPRQ